MKTNAEATWILGSRVDATSYTDACDPQIHPLDSVILYGLFAPSEVKHPDHLVSFRLVAYEP